MSEGEHLSEADRIRLKRLARLGRPSTHTDGVDPASSSPQAIEQSPSPSQAAPRAPPSASSRLLSNRASSSTASSPSITPVRKTSPAVDGSKIATTSLTKHSTPQPRVASPAPRATPAIQAKASPSLPYDQWASQAISAVFSASLNRSQAEASEWRLCWLKDLEQELRDEGVKAVATPDLCDRILIARLSLDPEALAHSDDPDKLLILASLPQDETIFEYLTGCWKRLYAQSRVFSRIEYSVSEKTAWQQLFERMKSLLISYCGMTLEDPTMFPQPQNRPTGPAEFLPILLALTPAESPGDPLTSGTTSKAAEPTSLGPADLLPFLHDLAAGTQDALSDVLTPTLSLFFQEWFKLDPTPDITGSDWRRYLGAVSTLVQVKTIAGLLPSLSIWMAPGVTAPKMEWQSLLGPLTRLSVYPREFGQIWKAYFSNPTERKTDDINANKSNLRHTLNALQTSLYGIYNSIVRASPESREGVLAFFAQVVHLNSRRAGISVSSTLVSSDGYMTNLQAVLLKLFEPVMDVSFSKLDKVDPDYYGKSSRIDIKEETRINATREEVDEYSSHMQVDGSPPNFISDIFFLLNSFQRLGLLKTISTRIRAEKNITEIEKELKRAEAARGSWAGNPAMEAQGEAAITKLKSDLSTLHASIHAYDTQLLDPALTRLNINFVTFLMTWLTRLVDPRHQHPTTPISLPLAKEAPMQFRMLPEYLIENVVEYLDFLFRYNPEVLENPDKDILITFAIVFLTPGYINNPFLKAKLISILANGLYPVGYYPKGTLFDRLGINPLSTEFLMPTMIRFFIDVEHTGGHTQFWDKFNFRRDMSRIIRTMWNNPLHREAFIKSRHDDFDQFIKFVNMLMSDTTFHLEESLTNLAKIHAIQSQQADQQAWSGLPESEQQDLSSQLGQAESAAPFHTAMGLDHVELIRDITATTPEPFTTGEIVDRLAATLDENLANLVGPKMQELRVSDPEKFAFKPKRLLAGIAQIYLNLAQDSEFIRAVANDGRSYKKELFEKFARILKHRAIMTDAEVSEVVSFTQKVEDMKATIMMEDEREIPDEFLDPLLSTLMKDPVILPVSRQIVDRSTIRTVLLSKEIDPFNNLPLKLEDCIPADDLKARIDAWVAEGKTQQAASVMDVDSL
ncbi:ubiquitin elongating factor core-domain-containing protein [Papiliotrema laurentii]|uniref:RING-type E3 ubiquitin transferase n=1 Tax=Papiliotrema laurentii TaxID=5418 RepID=A0AAD9FP94_PAPLA|nr:ubiquitin elongating factor core-domain-containing protein [Papiliotrema laurentii]